jgi:hypothetical protein
MALFFFFFFFAVSLIFTRIDSVYFEIFHQDLLFMFASEATVNPMVYLSSPCRRRRWLKAMEYRESGVSLENKADTSLFLDVCLELNVTLTERPSRDRHAGIGSRRAARCTLRLPLTQDTVPVRFDMGTGERWRTTICRRRRQQRPRNR